MKTRKINKTRNPDPAAPHVPSEWHRHYRTLQSLREVLIADHDGMASEMAEPIEPHSMDDADSATDEFDHDLALIILSHEENMLFEVESAIQRIMDGTYGICEATGKPIPKARLRVVPWTRYTKEALEEIERRSAGGRPRMSGVSSIQGLAFGGLPDAPEPEDLMSFEAARRRQSEILREFTGHDGFNITPHLTAEP